MLPSPCPPGRAQQPVQNEMYAPMATSAASMCRREKSHLSGTQGGRATRPHWGGGPHQPVRRALPKRTSAAAAGARRTHDNLRHCTHTHIQMPASVSKKSTLCKDLFEVASRCDLDNMPRTFYMTMMGGRLFSM